MALSMFLFLFGWTMVSECLYGIHICMYIISIMHYGLQLLFGGDCMEFKRTWEIRVLVGMGMNEY